MEPRITLFQYLLQQFDLMQTLDFFLRIVVACICGSAIGYERSRRFKGAGIRTHIIVCCGAALIMIISKYGFADLTNTAGAAFNGTRGADPARVAAQVVSGISFIGAGVIFKNSGAVRGLTTAAGIWATAAIGLAIGSGMYTIGIFATVLIALLQVLMHKFKIGADSYNAYQIQFTVKDSENLHTEIQQQLHRWDAQMTNTRVAHNEDGSVYYDITIRTTQNLNLDDMLTFFSDKDEVRNLSLENIH